MESETNRRWLLNNLRSGAVPGEGLPRAVALETLLYCQEQLRPDLEEHELHVISERIAELSRPTAGAR